MSVYGYLLQIFLGIYTSTFLSLVKKLNSNSPGTVRLHLALLM